MPAWLHLTAYWASFNFKSICRPRLLCFRRSGRLLAKGFRKGNLYFLSASVGQAHHTRVSSSFIANGSTPSGLGLGCTCSLADDLIGLSSVKGLRSSALLLKRIPLSIPPILISFAAGIRPPLMDVWPEGSSTARKFRRASFEIHSAAGPARDVDLGTNLPSAPTLCVPYC
ncbi:hypothetical protein Q3G72_004718 [Acer saccharum]|nr:hypothetical protein Q3G72_004718 [Acer saccharum]